MINSDERNGNAFTDDLYNAIRKGILKDRSEESCDLTRHNGDGSITERLESPQKEQFTALFVELKIKNEPLDTNSVLRVCHRLLEQNKMPRSISASTPRPDRIVGPRLMLSDEHRLHLDDCAYDQNEPGPSSPSPGTICGAQNDRVATDLPRSANKHVMSASSKVIRSQVFSNLMQCSQGAKWIETDANAVEMIPGLEFMVDPVTELGRLHNTIKDYVNEVDGTCCGRTVKALKIALAKEINSYYAYMNTWLRENFEALDNSSDGLHTFVPFDHKVLMRFRCLAETVENSKSKYGCNLISTLVFSKIREIENTILHEIAKPVQAMIIRWMTDGELEDEHGEFFVVKTSSENYWRDSHELSSTNKLEFLNKRQLNGIYETGKNMNFLLNVLGLNADTKIEKLRENIAGLVNEDGLLIELADKYSRASTIVLDAVDQSSALMVGVLIDKYDMFVHFEGLRNYMLFGRGDFYAYIVFKLEPYFGNKKMHNYQLREIVETARNLTSARNDDKKSFDCLRYSVDWTGEVNWDSFKFEYVTDEPLSQVFGPCSNHYANVFQFLWRLKKVDWTANKMWHGLTYFIKTSHNIFDLRPVLRNTKALLSSIVGCINDIQNFVFETINDEWKQFRSEMSRVTCIKTIMDAQMSFLESITKCADDSSVSVYEYVESLEKLVEMFADVFECFVCKMKGLSSPKSEPPNASSSTVSYFVQDQLINKFMADLEAMKNSYEVDLGDLLSRLADSGTTLSLGTLAMRIDFNRYYSSSAATVPSRII